MAIVKGNKKRVKKVTSKRMWLVDPIYRKFTAKAFKALTSGEFFDFFMNMMKNGEQEFQFSNRKIVIDVDESWLDIIEDTIPAFMEITRNPRVIITQEELVTNVVQAKRIDSQVVRHLCAHSYLVDAIDEEGNVIPNKVLNIFKEETWDTYENRFVYTLLKKAYDFVAKRFQDMKEAMSDEFGASLIIDATGETKMESLEIHSRMKIKQKDDWNDDEAGKRSVFSRVKYLYESLGKLLETRFAKEMFKYQIVRPPLVPTNAIKKNPFLRKCHALWNFLLTYSEAGYSLEIIEQLPDINHKFEQDIIDNIMFTYIILKGYLEDNRDRALDRTVKSRRTTIKPKYIRQIIEEMVEDFNLSEVEVRKIMLKELTKEELMREERDERYRIIEEQRRAEEEKKYQAEMERIRVQKEKEKQQLLRAREREKERARKQRERIRAKERLEKERKKKEIMDAKRLVFIEEELNKQMANIERCRVDKYWRDHPEELAEANRIREEERKQAAKERRAKAAEDKKNGVQPKKAQPKKKAKPAPKPAVQVNPLDDLMEFGANRSAAEMSQYNSQLAKANAQSFGLKQENEKDSSIPDLTSTKKEGYGYESTVEGFDDVFNELEEMFRVEVDGAPLVMYKEGEKKTKQEASDSVDDKSQSASVQEEKDQKNADKPSGIGRFNPFKRGGR